MTAHPIPAAVLGGHLAVLGTSGSGKTNAIKGAIERALERSERVIIVDPTGVWWGMRLDAKGKGPSPYPLVIFGGRHGDLPLDEGSGERIAQVLGTSTTPAILDMQQMSVAARTRFFTAFAEAIRRENRGPLILVLDEAHLFAPQQGRGGGLLPDLLHATNNLVALGRSAGISVVMITQRAAKLHKDALSQAAALVVMGLIDPRDQKAARAWLEGAPDQTMSKEILASLASLPIGSGWVYAPRLAVLEKVDFPLVSTFDSGRPEANADAPALKPLDVGALREALAVHGSLQAKLITKRGAGGAGAPAAERPASTAEVAEAERRGETVGLRRGAAAGWKAAMSIFALELGSFASLLPDTPGEHELGEQRIAEILLADAPAALVPTRAKTPPAPAPPLKGPTCLEKPASPPPSAKDAGASSTLTGPQRELLRALAWWRAMGHDAPTRTQVAAIAGWKPKGSNLRNRLSELSAVDMVAYPRAGVVALTVAGRKNAPDPDLGTTLRQSILGVLTGPQAAVFAELERARQPVTRADLAVAIGWEPTGSNLRNRLSELSALELVDYPTRGTVALQPWVTA